MDMNREILFRGKRLDNGEWTCGSLLTYADGSCFICCEIYPGKLNKLQVDPSTVGQYTGLMDKNGKKIFEGDIIHYGYEPGNGFWNAVQDSIIEWRLHGLYMNGIMGTNKYSCLCGYICSIPWSPDIVEVIGNRWDNPELVEELK